MIRYYEGSRHVVVLESLTFKIPKLWLDRLWHIVRHDPVKDWWFYYRQYLGASFGENYTEAKWFFKQKPPQIVPCILPLVMINVYPTQQGVGVLKVSEWLGKFKYPPTSEGAKFSDAFWDAFSYMGASHTFRHNENYALHNGEARLLDYGGAGVMELIMNHQEEFGRFLETVKEYTYVHSRPAK